MKVDGSVRICRDYKVTVCKSGHQGRFIPTALHWRHPGIPGRWSKLFKAGPCPCVPAAAFGWGFEEIGHRQYPQRVIPIQPPFGILSASWIFNRSLKAFCRDWTMFQCTNVDDILLTGTTMKEHLQLLEEVLCWLEEAEAWLKKSECAFMLPSVEYLGYTWMPSKLMAFSLLQERFVHWWMYPGPRTHLSWSHISSVWLAPLHQLLKKNAKWSWERAHYLDFKKVKEALMSSHVLAHYDQDLPLILECDASHYRLGAVLSLEIEDGSTKPISFTDHSLTPTEKGTHTLTRRNWPSYLGLKVSSLPSWTKVQLQAFTDLFAETKPVPAMALAMVKRWVLNLSGYKYTIR